MQKLQLALSRLDIHELEKLAGTTIVRAVKGAYETNRERELARLVVDRYGNGILTKREIRLALIDILSTQEANAACTRLGIFGITPHQSLQSRFGTNFTRKKAEEFVSLFALSESLIPEEQIDLRESSEEICPTYGNSIVSKGVLHPYQRRLKDALRAELDKGKRKMMAQMPTGAGKTVTALEILVDYLRQPNHDRLIVWVVDSNELAEQALQAFRELWLLRGDRPTRAYRFFNNFSAPFASCLPGVVFASFRTATSWLDSQDTSKKESFRGLCRRAELVIVDEAHASIAESFEQVVRALTQYNAVLVGLSATPGRNNPHQNMELASLYGDELVSITDENGRQVADPVRHLINQGYLAEVMFEQLESGTTLSESNETVICERLAEDYERNKKIVLQVERAITESQSTIVFACTVAHVIALTALCRAKDLKTGFIIGEVSSVERQSLLEEFRLGRLKVLINYDILSAGVDLPNVNKLIVTRPVGSPILYSQILGRALRGPKNGGNKKNHVVTIADNLMNYEDPSRIYLGFQNNF